MSERTIVQGHTLRQALHNAAKRRLRLATQTKATKDTRAYVVCDNNVTTKGVSFFPFGRRRQGNETNERHNQTQWEKAKENCVSV